MRSPNHLLDVLAFHISGQNTGLVVRILGEQFSFESLELSLTINMQRATQALFPRPSYRNKPGEDGGSARLATHTFGCRHAIGSMASSIKSIVAVHRGSRHGIVVWH